MNIFDADGFLLCPTCGFNYAHVITSRQDAKNERVTTIMDGECGHLYLVVLEVNKGNPTIRTSPIA